MARYVSWLQDFAVGEDGATAVEYALMVALIAVVIVGAVTSLGGAANSKFSSAASGLSSAS